MALGPEDQTALRIIEMQVQQYRDSDQEPAMPLAKAVIGALGGDAELRGHEVAIGYLTQICGYSHATAGWIVGQPLAVEWTHAQAERLAAVELPSGPNPEARERERLRREARDGTCPTCGATEPSRADAMLEQYARVTTRLHALLSECEKKA